MLTLQVILSGSLDRASTGAEGEADGRIGNTKPNETEIVLDRRMVMQTAIAGAKQKNMINHKLGLCIQ